MTPVATHRALRSVVASSREFTLEPLEERRLFAAIDLVERTVVVQGTDTRDLLIIQQMPNYNGRMAVQITAQSYATGSDGGFGIAGATRVFYRDEIDQIRFEGGAGDDDVFC